uniref:LRRCT domain-containing protein n=1 Tax=Branchiostoma floridae TaxID=7739 RepID=C3YME5_BRAFL|eukprot:XP_002602727.1 hypothetical protein BRAFLDRAFT_72911 [Branchiostoma floridae]
MCQIPNGRVLSGSLFPLLVGAKRVAVRGYPFHTLSVKSLAQLEHSRLDALGLIEAKITDVENNTFARFSRLQQLSLDSNRLTNVRQAWFTGLKRLMRLILSNNHIKQIEPGSFEHLNHLHILDLENNLLQVVDPAWLYGPKYEMIIYMGLNGIHSISPDAFQHVQLAQMHLAGNSMSWLDADVFRGQSLLKRLHVSSGMLASVLDEKPQAVMWSLHRLASVIRGSTLLVGVPKSLFCVRQNMDANHSSNMTHYSEHDYTSSDPIDISTLQVSTTPGLEVATDHVLISVVVSAVFSLVLLLLAVLAWKLCSSKMNGEDEVASDDAHVWTIPPGVAFPGLLRSASLPACSNKMASDDAASCMSLPAVLDSVKPTYSEIPDDMAAAHRPLPGLPHTYWEIPDDAISFVARCSSLPAVPCTSGSNADDAASCRSLPAVLQSIEPTYSDIPDHIAAAQRPLPILPRTAWEAADHDTAAQRPLPALRHTYNEIPCDEESGPMPFYTDAVELLQHVVINRRGNQRAFRDNTTSSSMHRSGGSFATYGSADQSRAQRNNFYIKTPEVQGIRVRRNLRTALASQPADHGLRTYVNVTDANLSRGQNVTEVHVSFLTLPGANWPWEMPNDGTRITPRHASLPLVTLPNTYWPWEIQGEGTHNTSNRASRSPVTLPNTYWPWELQLREPVTHNGARPSPMSQFLTPTGHGSYQLREPLTAEGTRNTQRRASLPHVAVPNTYWPWELPAEGTRNTQRRAPLPLATLPNTYWPWELTAEGTRNTQRRASLPHVAVPNTYWPWELPAEGTRNTQRRASLPHVTLPNTYWPWELPAEGTRNTQRRASLPLVTAPNTYWPWEIHRGGNP